MTKGKSKYEDKEEKGKEREKRKRESEREGGKPSLKIRCPHSKDMAQSTTETTIRKSREQRNSKFWSTCTDVRQAAIAQYL